MKTAVLMAASVVYAGRNIDPEGCNFSGTVARPKPYRPAGASHVGEPTEAVSTPALTCLGSEIRVEELLCGGCVRAVPEIRPVASVAEGTRVEGHHGPLVEHWSARIADAYTLCDLDEPVGELVVRGDDGDVSEAADAIEDGDRLRRGGAAVTKVSVP